MAPKLRLIFARPSLLTIRRFDITFIISLLHTHTLGSVFLHTLLRIHCTFCQMYLIENSQFIAEQRVDSRHHNGAARGVSGVAGGHSGFLQDEG